jgi:metal-dependent HD superfamily phosphatase/phosphodiesterase
LVGVELVQKHLAEDIVASTYRFLERDNETQECLKMANVMAVTRMGYNDHGVVHSRIVSGSSLELFDLLQRRVQPSVVRDRTGDLNDSQVVVLLGAYLHDIGNAVHRNMHHVHACYLAKPILQRVLAELYPHDADRQIRMMHEALHCVFAHDDPVSCLSVEAGIVKVADGTDMAGGRARIPYNLGKVDSHSISALAVNRVEITEGGSRPVRVLVDMTNPAGIFQVESVLMRKVRTSGLSDLIEVVATVGGQELKTIPEKGEARFR